MAKNNYYSFYCLAVTRWGHAVLLRDPTMKNDILSSSNLLLVDVSYTLDRALTGFLNPLPCKFATI